MSDNLSFSQPALPLNQQHFLDLELCLAIGRFNTPGDFRVDVDDSICPADHFTGNYSLSRISVLCRKAFVGNHRYFLHEQPATAMSIDQFAFDESRKGIIDITQDLNSHADHWISAFRTKLPVTRHTKAFCGSLKMDRLVRSVRDTSTAFLGKFGLICNQPLPVNASITKQPRTCGPAPRKCPNSSAGSPASSKESAKTRSRSRSSSPLIGFQCW